jgi:dTDP-4-amino-4,6-dideoxygalactose transaminase
MRCKVRYFDYPMQFKAQESDYMKTIKEVLSKGAFISGEDLRIFEAELAKFCSSKYSIGVGNCTDALLLSLYAAGIKTGDEVISVSHTFVATIEVIKMLGADPILIDVGDDHNMDMDCVEAAITPRTKAIMPVHLNGKICNNMDKLLAIATKHKVLIIEDAAQSLGATYKGKKAGTFGLAGCFSFYPAKLLGAFGDAGAVVTDNEEIAKKVRMARDHGRVRGNDIGMWGLNCRMDNLQAAILNLKIAKVRRLISRRREIAAIYHEELRNVKEIKLPRPPADNENFFDVFQNYEIEAKKRDELRSYLAKEGVETAMPWGGRSVHQFKSLGLNYFKLPRTEQLFRRVLMLPMYPSLIDKQVVFISKRIKEFYKHK